MRFFIISFVLVVGLGLSAQDSPLPELDTLPVQLERDTLEGLSIFNPDDISSHMERLVGYKGMNRVKDWYFYGVIAFSLSLITLYSGSREIVSASFKSFFSLQHNLQKNRTDKQNQLLVLIFYLVLFIVGATVVVHFILGNFLESSASIWSIFLVCTLYFIWDYLSSNIYYLFSNNSRSIDLVKSISLSFSPIWTFVIWIALFFVLLSSFQIAQFSAIAVSALLGLLIMAKELRVLQVLWFEKINIISFHFFAYLCTFKILPFILLIVLVF